MTWEIVVGIETHAQLLTKSKIFSGAPNAFGAAPNTQASAVDVALPGTLPVANRAAIEHAIRFGLAVKGKISPRSVFARKNYFYPDLPKGYQISQYEIPVVQGGKVRFFVDKEEKSIRLTRAHLEEDAGKSIHDGGFDSASFDQDSFQTNSIPDDCSGIDFNRAGTPLLEIVTEPELRGAKEAIAYARTLHSLVRWIGICDGNMQEGSFRCDANVSVRKVGDTELGTRCEIKNLNSFRFMEQAIEYEAKRQIAILEKGGSIEQQTRLYDADKNETRSMRSKEDAQDYRYFPDPDLLPLVISAEEIETIKKQLPELPEAKRKRYQDDFRLSVYDSVTLTQSREMAEYFENAASNPEVLQESKAKPALFEGFGKLVANWVTGELSAALNKSEMDISRSPVSPAQLSWLLARLKDGTINAIGAKDAFHSMWKGENVGVANVTFAPMQVSATGHQVITPGTASLEMQSESPRVKIDKLIDAKGLKQVTDAGAIEKIVDEVLAANAKQVEDYRSGKEKAFNSLVGQVMKRSQGKANPAQVNEILRRKLAT